METKKLSDTQLEVTRETPQPVVEKQTYERNFIENQIINITKQRDDLIALKEAELAECVAILAEMDLKGIITKEELVVEKEPLQEEVMEV